MNENETRIPQCAGCPLARLHSSLPATHSAPSETGTFECTITGELIPPGQEPREGECQYLAGYCAASTHPLDLATALENWEEAAEWLAANVPAEVLRRAWPGPSQEFIEAWNEFCPRADGRIEN